MKYFLFFSFCICLLIHPRELFAQDEAVVTNDTNYIYRSLSEAMKNPEHVYRLYLIKAKLDSFPKVIFQFKNLWDLNLSKNNLEEIPAEIGSLTSLQKLNVSNNKLVHVPQEIGQLTNLTYLGLNRNEIEELPSTIGNLEKLEVLELWDNELKDVPDEISNLKNLKIIELRGILFTEEQQQRIDGLVIKSAKLFMSPACNCKY